MKMKKIYSYIVIAAMSATAVSCNTFYSSYERSNVEYVNSLYEADTTHAALATLSWRELFTDSLLQKWIDVGLTYNTDLQVARLRVDQAEATLKITQQAFLPSVSASLNATLSGTAGSGNGAKLGYSLTPTAQWEADIFGRQRNALKSAEADFESSKAYQQAVQSKLIATIANSYYSLLMLDEQLHTSQRTLETWEENIRTLTALKRAGKTNESAVLQAKASKLSVEGSVITLERQIAEQESSLCALLGILPIKIERSSLREQHLPENISVGIPLEALSIRPDVRQAEGNLMASFYDINIARAAFYPSLTLSGSMGWSDAAGKAVTDPGAFVLNAVAGVMQPIFAKGANKARLKIAETEYKASLISYRQTLLDAGVEVNNALKLWQSAQERVDIDLKQVVTLRAAVWNTQLLMKYGSASYLEVLTAQQNLLNAELAESTDRYAVLQGIVSLYYALGGGAN